MVKKKPTQELTPLEKARLARAANKAKGVTSPKPSYPTWVAPADFKPHFLELLVKTDKDGLLAPMIKGVRYQGRWDPECDPRKKFLMNEYDQQTLNGILSRLSMTTYITNVKKRLPADTTFRIVLRVGASKVKGNILTVGFRQIDRIARLKSGKRKPVMLDKRDPIYRRFRMSSRILPCAFQAVLAPPKKTRSRSAEE